MQYRDVVNIVLEEHVRSVQLHGTWHDYSVEQMMATIINELMVEAADAVTRDDIVGEHGVIRELSQVAACCMKAIMVLSDRANSVLAQTSRDEGAQSEPRGCVFPASLSLPQDKESHVNHPKEVANG